MTDRVDDRLDDAARALRDALPALDARVDDVVMAEVRRRAPVRPVRPRAGAWHWFLEPRAVRVRPIWVAGLAAAAALAVWLAPHRAPAGAPAAAVASAARDTVYVHFALTAPTAHEVAVAGSFNAWNVDALPLHRTAAGTWEATVALPVGEHRYQFVVDGQRWIPDPSAQAQVDDGFGGTNSVIVVGPKGVVRS